MDKHKKKILRQESRHRRAHYHGTVLQADIDQTLIEGIRKLKIPLTKVIAGYIALGSELNIMALLKVLFHEGYKIVLPVVSKKEDQLLFRLWSPKIALIPDDQNIPAPGPENPEMKPDVLFVPLLAFDEQGNRLGQGLAYYDRTLWDLTKQKEILTIGIGYEIQKVPSIPAHPEDYPMDFVLTDKKIHLLQHN